MRIVRVIGGIVAGVGAAFAIVAGPENIGSALFRSPPLMNDGSADLARWMAAVPLPAKLIVVAGWALAAFAGPWLALRITDRAWTGWVVSALFLAASVANQATLPHPLWMQVCAVLLPLLGGWLAQARHRKPYAGEALLG